MAQRIQSPSSINYNNMCPRCYYYRYIKKLSLAPSIHLIRGKIVHAALEDFFDLKTSEIDKEHYEIELNIILQSIFKQRWEESKDQLDELKLDEKQEKYFFGESVNMLNNWFNRFIKKVITRAEKTDFKEAFNTAKPQTEVHFVSEEHKVQGYIDAIEEFEGDVSLIDYKTSRMDHMTDEYKLQLAIYALLYNEKYGKHPNSVGIDFLRKNKKYLKVDQELIDHAIEQCRLIQEKTKTDDIKDYPQSNHRFCECSKYVDVLEKTTLNKYF